MKYILIPMILLFFFSCADKKPGIKPEANIWPYEFYQKFNLRSITSSYSGALRYYCASYPQDFFRPDQLYMPNTNKIIIENEDIYLSFEIVSRGQIIIIDGAKDASFRNTHLYNIYYNEDEDDYRSDLFFIEKNENCKQYVIKVDENVSK